MSDIHEPSSERSDSAGHVVTAGESSGDPKKTLSVVIPCFRSEETLERLYQRLDSLLRSHGLVADFVFVNDASPDDVSGVLRRLHAQDPDRVTVVELMRNFGQHNALMCGFRHARGDVIVTMDDDLQNPPEEIAKLLSELHEGNHDLVYGVPQSKQHALGRKSWVTPRQCLLPARFPNGCDRYVVPRQSVVNLLRLF